MQIDVNMQLSHMLANDIARSGEESAILDTVHTLKRTVTRDSLSADIQEVFHITIADSKLAGHVKNMLLDGRLIERDSALMLSPASLETITQQIIGNEAIEQKALSLWIQQLETILDRHLNDVEATSVRRIIVKFVARFFITHGAGCYDFINGIKAQNTEKLDDVANLIVESQENCVVTGLSKQEFSHFLVSIFSKDKTVEQEAYLLIQLRKAMSTPLPLNEAAKRGYRFRLKPDGCRAFPNHSVIWIKDCPKRSVEETPVTSIGKGEISIDAFRRFLIQEFCC